MAARARQAGAHGGGAPALRRGGRVLPHRAPNYVHMFDPAIRLLPGPRRGRLAGSRPPGDYDPRVWGHEHDYTETNGWNFAFHVPHDGQGLANLYGGRDGLAEQARRRSSPRPRRPVPRLLRRHHPRDGRGARRADGPVGLHATRCRTTSSTCTTTPGSPARPRRRCARRCRRLYLGSEIGQGYAGDEDNGEMSAWYLFSALGLLPAAGGQRRLRDRLAAVQARPPCTWRTAGSSWSARRNSRRNVYVQGAAGQRQALRPRRTCRTRSSPTARCSTSTWARPSDWGTGRGRRAPLAHPGRSAAAARRCADADGRRRRATRRCSTTTRAPRRRLGAPAGVTLAGGPSACHYYTLTSGPDGAA